MTQRGTVLLTGFEPFGGDAENPSAAIVAALQGRDLGGGHRIEGRTLPVEFGRAARVLRSAIRAVDPAVVICLGLAGNRTAISIERVAINLDDARIADNAGGQPIDRPIVAGGPAAYWSTLPVKAVQATVAAQGWPAEVSHTAGTFVCNHVFYALMRALRRRPGCRGGFVHVPWPTVAFPLPAMTAAIETVARTTLAERTDRALIGGAIA